ncbi:hypothetical protein [Microbacterium maritypicum]
MWGYYGNDMMGAMVVWGAVGLAFLVAIVAAAAFLVAFLVRRDVGARATPPEEASPAEILRRRFAVGEIDDEEFKRRLSALQ